MDRHEIEREIRKLHEKSFAFALACCGWNRADAEDALHSAYVAVLDGARFDARSSLKTWLFAIIRRTAASARRRAWLARRLGIALRDHGQTMSLTDPVPEPPSRVRSALASLAPRQREMLDLVFFHDMTIEDAANVMGVSVGTARVHYERGKKRMAERLR